MNIQSNLPFIYFIFYFRETANLVVKKSSCCQEGNGERRRKEMGKTQEGHGKDAGKTSLSMKKESETDNSNGHTRRLYRQKIDEAFGSLAGGSRIRLKRILSLRRRETGDKRGFVAVSVDPYTSYEGFLRFLLLVERICECRERHFHRRQIGRKLICKSIVN